MSHRASINNIVSNMVEADLKREKKSNLPPTPRRPSIPIEQIQSELR